SSRIRSLLASGSPWCARMLTINSAGEGRSDCICFYRSRAAGRLPPSDRATYAVRSNETQDSVPRTSQDSVAEASEKQEELRHRTCRDPVNHHGQASFHAVPVPACL